VIGAAAAAPPGHHCTLFAAAQVANTSPFGATATPFGEAQEPASAVGVAPPACPPLGQYTITFELWQAAYRF
jgi:hypothetical protein